MVATKPSASFTASIAFRAQVTLRKKATKSSLDQYRSEQASEYDQRCEGGIHREFINVR
jgi:hypothetical protein